MLWRSWSQLLFPHMIYNSPHVQRISSYCINGPTHQTSWQCQYPSGWPLFVIAATQKFSWPTFVHLKCSHTQRYHCSKLNRVKQLEETRERGLDGIFETLNDAGRIVYGVCIHITFNIHPGKFSLSPDSTCSHVRFHTVSNVFGFGRWAWWPPCSSCGLGLLLASKQKVNSNIFTWVCTQINF